jgi:hypothetical protein
MRGWRDAANGSMRIVSARPELWLPGALGWIVTVGWIPFVVAVASPPSVGELTFIGARIVTSGAWPWNAVLIGAGALAVVLIAFVLAAGANTVLIAQLSRSAPSAANTGRLLAVNVVLALPAAVTATVVLLALAGVAPREFNAPDPSSGPILRTLGRLAPYLILFGLAAAAGAVLASVAGRLAIAGKRARVAQALRSAPSVAVRSGPATHAVVAWLAQLIFLGLGTLLLGVLWAPIGAQLAIGGEFDIVTGLLLVGFVAIWLCLVLAGGALHAWSTTTWSLLLAKHPSGRT